MIIRTQGYQSVLSEIAGIEELVQEAGTSGVRRLAVEAARIARQHVPKDTKKLFKSIRAGHVRPFKGMGKGQKNKKMEGYFGSDLHYAHLVEFGTAPHRITKGYRKRKAKTDVETADSGGMHPGSRPRPYIRPALDTIQTQAAGVLAEVIRKRLARKK